MIGYGTTNTKIVKIPDENISKTDIANSLKIENTTYYGTEIKIIKDCCIDFKISTHELEGYESKKLQWGISINSNQLTTDFYYIDLENVLFCYQDCFMINTNNNWKASKGDIFRLHTNGVLLKHVAIHIITQNT